MADGRFAHVILQNISVGEKFATPKSGGKSKFPSRVQNREAHATRLLGLLHTSRNEAAPAVARRADRLSQEENGIYLTIESRPGEPLVTDRLEQKKNRIELLAVKTEADRSAATIFIPESAKEFLSKRIEDYRTKNDPRAAQPEPKGWRLIEGIGGIHLAALRDLWIDVPTRFPAAGEVIDWEVWLRPTATERFRQAAREAGAIVGASSLIFPEDVALFAQTSAEVLAQLNEATLGITRLARAKKVAGYVINLTPDEQARELDEFLNRVHVPEAVQTALCVLDTGVNRAHRLLSTLIAAQDCHAFDTEWGVGDHHGHGTGMAGIGGYGDLALAMNGNHPVSVPYVLESSKIIPPVGRNPYDLYGAITAGGIAKVELAQPQRKRIFCLATTTDEDTPHGGKPTSWSAELDQLCFGSAVTSKEGRLICVSAGNIRELPLAHADYLQLNDVHEIESPAHAWNALSVGAFTRMTEIIDPTYAGWIPFAASGDLCPVSRTGAWVDTWPVKPDVVMEGGNCGVDPANGMGSEVPDLRLLTTSKDYPQVIFETFGDTSGATANAARLCAIVQSHYPDLWPETIRALVVDSAMWTDAMLSHLPAEPKKTDHALILRRYGFGVPDLERAVYSARNALTLVAQDAIRPYLRVGSKKARLNEMKVFQLPWPREALTELGNTEVQMRVTLSYYIEPNPAESARNRKLRYASHGLRFAVKLPDEEDDAFRRRINKAAREEGGTAHHETDTAWRLGPNLRDRGSVHSDLWHGPATDLARRGVVAVYPVSGWWKDREQLERYHRSARFALIVSIQTPTPEVDIYTPVLNQIPIHV
jgi:hypothetical protein